MLFHELLQNALYDLALRQTFVMCVVMQPVVDRMREPDVRGALPRPLKR